MASPNWEHEFGKILTKLLLRKDSEVFREPVDWEALQIPDYPDIIKHPMDLGTVNNKFSSHQYKKAEDAAADVRQIWINSMLYNAPGVMKWCSKIYLSAKTLSEYWEGQWAHVYKEDPERPPSHEEMSSWVEMCHRISTTELGKVLQMLDQSYPQCLIKKNDVNEVEVNIDVIPGKVFREAFQYVYSCLPDVALTRRAKQQQGQPSNTPGSLSAPTASASKRPPEGSGDMIPSKKLK